MSRTILALDAKIRRAIGPDKIDGVSSLQIRFTPAASEADKEKAEAILVTFDPNEPAQALDAKIRQAIGPGKLDGAPACQIWFTPAATEADKEKATAILETFDPNEPTHAEVNIERDRRASTFVFGASSFDLSFANGSLANITGAGSLALAAIVAGAEAGNLRWASPDEDFYWITNDNRKVSMDAQTTLAFARAAAAWRTAMTYRARALKDMATVPIDFRDDKYWA